MVERSIKNSLLHFSGLYPVVSLTGPRQSGKTTLVKAAFPDYDYYSLEDPDVRMFAQNDPRKFLQTTAKGMIIDEAQRVPDLFSYIQGIVDKADQAGQYILTGSQNFLLLEKISQTLAGRVAILKLLPFSILELKTALIDITKTERLIYNGFYPRIYDKHLEPSDYYSFYLQTYIERDVKLIRHISDQSTFIRFMQMCAGRLGQLINISELANSCGITQVTAKAWFSVLEASFIIYFLRPHHKNYNKRLVKMPKLYFYDTGLATFLLGIKNPDQLITHFAYGQIFENLVINEFIKYRYNRAETPELYFWRDKNGKEVDLLIKSSKDLIPVEIKAGKTYSKDYFKNLNYWNKISGNKAENTWLIYNGDQNFTTSNGNLIAFMKLEEILIKFYKHV